MNGKPSAVDMLKQVEKKMVADFEASRASVGHNGAAGTDREGIVLDFLRRYLPASVRVWGSGEVVSADGSRSKQCDIIVTDPATPPLYERAGDSHRVVPSECVYGVVEVKTNLTKEELIAACENIKSAKKRPKTAFRPDYLPKETTRYGKTWKYTPSLGVIFAFEGAQLDYLGEAFAEWCEGVPHHLRPDSIWVLGRGGLSWTEPGDSMTLDGYSGDGGFLRAITPLDVGVLLPMLFRLNHQFQQVFMPPFDLEKYAAGTSLAGWGSTWGPISAGPAPAY